ncbi:MAG: methyltransferase domain-containing protein [Gammaproteobacteria bacterium]|nr:methyltransferase domain-containing protein [Gammaproteobacteria bacterium]
MTQDASQNPEDPEAGRKAFIRQTFDTVCAEYGRGNLRFFEKAAAGLPELLQLRGDEQLLDVATGTGLASTLLAAQLSRGHVTGIDLSDGMLQQASERARAMGLSNIDFRQMDMTRMDLPEDAFDIINCSFGVFFVEDLNGLMRHIVTRLKPGGRLLTTHFAQGSMSPMQELIMQRLKDYGVDVPQAAWSQLDSEAANRDLYEAAGLSNIHHQRRQVGYYFDSAEGWWDVVWWAGFRGFVNQIDEDRIEQFKREHLQEVESLRDDKGIFFNVEVIHTLGERPLS